MQKSNHISKDKLAGIFNFAPHYRLSIFNGLAQELNMDFYFGTRVLTDIKPLDYTQLKGFKALLPTKFIKRFYYNKGLFTLLRQNKYDKLLFTGEVKNISAWVALFLKCFYPKLRVMLWTHGWYGNEKGLDKFVKLLMYRWADHLFLYGDYAKNLLITQGIPESKLSVVYNSLDYEEQVKLRDTLEKSSKYKECFKNDFPTIVYIGRIQEVKRIDWLIRLISELEKKDIHANLILIGEGEQCEALKTEATNLGLAKRICFYGACYNEEELADLLFNATVCVSPGNVGLTAMHALVYGCPVITHDNFKSQMPEFEAIEPGITGDFYRENDFSSLVAVVANWLKKSQQESFCSDVSDACYRVIAEKYNTRVQLKTFKRSLDL